MTEADPLNPDDATQEEARLAELTDKADLRWIVSDPRGRRFVRRLLEWSGPLRTSFGGDALATAYREGERNIGTRLLAVLAADDPEGFAAVLTRKD